MFRFKRGQAEIYVLFQQSQNFILNDLPKLGSQYSTYFCLELPTDKKGARRCVQLLSSIQKMRYTDLLTACKESGLRNFTDLFSLVPSDRMHEMVQSCARGGLDWTLGSILHQEGSQTLEKAS